MKKNILSSDGMTAVVVTTAHRGVFFGRVSDDHDRSLPTVHLKRARMCIHWSADLKGILGLASQGPSKSCRIGPEVPSITLREVTSIMDVTLEAEAAWEKQPWAM